MFYLFEPNERKQRDMTEIQGLQSRFGDDFIDELATRAADDSLSLRDRKHWRRLYRKARAMG